MDKTTTDHRMKGTRKHMETESKYFDGDSSLSQSEENECIYVNTRHRCCQ